MSLLCSGVGDADRVTIPESRLTFGDDYDDGDYHHYDDNDDDGVQVTLHEEERGVRHNFILGSN